MFVNPLCFLVQIYVYIMIARVILSFVFMFRPGWVPPSGLRPILDAIYLLTDPPVNFLRRFIPQPFGFPLDLAFLAWFLIVQFLIGGIVCRLGF
ncbi:MAG: YggT family protein [Actinomycetota bacterium]